MREQNTIRIYDSRLSNKLENLFKETKDIYGTKNPFLVDCIKRGVDALEKDIKGSKNIESIGEIYDEIQTTIEKLNNLIKLCEKSSKEIMANFTVNQKLLSCNYNLLMGLTEQVPKDKDYVEAGMYDDLPERFESLLEDILNVFLKK